PVLQSLRPTLVVLEDLKRLAVAEDQPGGYAQQVHRGDRAVPLPQPLVHQRGAHLVVPGEQWFRIQRLQPCVVRVHEPALAQPGFHCHAAPLRHSPYRHPFGR
ncbi:hypothetical protein STRIP9103_00788, partial [Streptomyces ipomoeae 91-03]